MLDSQVTNMYAMPVRHTQQNPGFRKAVIVSLTAKNL